MNVAPNGLNLQLIASYTCILWGFFLLAPVHEEKQAFTQNVHLNVSNTGTFVFRELSCDP